MSRHTPAQKRTVYEFVTSKPDNTLEVETNPDGEVHIRMAHDNFSAQRKAYLVRELAAEGFIPDHFLYLSDNELLGVKWSLRPDPPKAPPQAGALAAYRLRILVASCFLLWSALILALVLGAFRS